MPSLPVPIELIVDQTYGLRIETRAIDEPPGLKILGALFRDGPCIVLNERHGRLFETVIGPLEFTLAHELGHWLYDADFQQLELLSDAAAPTYCYDGGSDNLSDTARIREINANKLAAAVLMPSDLIRAVDPTELLARHRQYARDWGVSGKALEIRLRELGIANQKDPSSGTSS